ncbi:MAG: exodeoxyribonuclease VII large subunit, partial [Candidatus Omnitrophota bacterium]
MSKVEEKIYTVSEITKDIRFLLEDAFPEVWVEGEVSNFKIYTSGHAYFSLKDENSLLSCVMFKGNSSR